MTADVKVLMAGIVQAFAGMDVEEYAAAADAFLRGGKHPTLGRPFHACGYLPMVELLGYLEANGFTNYIASGGDRDFMRPVTEEIYNIPSERVIGSSNALRYLEDEHGGTITTRPSRTSSTTGRSSRSGSGAGSAGARSSPAATRTATSRCCATRAARDGPRCGCSSCTTTPSGSSTTRPAPRSPSSRPPPEGWTVVSIKNDWSTVFADAA